MIPPSETMDEIIEAMGTTKQVLAEDVFERANILFQGGRIYESDASLLSSIFTHTTKEFWVNLEERYRSATKHL